MLDLPHARIIQRGPAYTGFLDCLSLRLFVRTVWLEDCAQEEQRESEEEDAEAAIAEHEKDRSGLEGARRRRRKFGG